MIKFSLIRDRIIAFMATFTPAMRFVYASDSLAKMESKSVVILPPSDYWAMNTTLPVKSEKEALKYAAALFDLGSDYRYEAQKRSDNTFILIAYNPEMILDNRPQLFTEESSELKITFAQWVFGDIQAPIRLNSGRFLTLHDDILIEMDERYVQTHSSVGINEFLNTLQKRVKTLDASTLLPQTLTPRILKTTWFILIILVMNTLYNSVTLDQERRLFSEQYEALLSESHLGSTSIEREAVLNALQQKEQKQLQLREKLFDLKEMPIVAKESSNMSAPMPVSTNLASTDGIVLIPGSKPGEPNRLLVNNQSEHNSTTTILGEGVREINYDGKSITALIDAKNPEELKKVFLKRFKNAKVDLYDTHLEVRLK